MAKLPAVPSKVSPARPRKARPVIRAKAPTETVLESFGISDFATALGVDEDFAVAVCCSILAGIAGPEGYLETPWGPGRLPKLDLLATKDSSPGARLIGCLTDPVERINGRLAHNMARCNPDAIEFLAFGAFSGDVSKKPHLDARDATLRRNLTFLTTNEGLKGDLVIDATARRVEAILHPGILLRRAAGHDLPLLLDECHYRNALVVEPSLGLGREGPEPAKAIRELLPLLNGALTRIRSSSSRSRKGFGPARGQVILTLCRDELGALSGAAAELLDRMLWISPTVGRLAASAKPDGASIFLDAYEDTILEVVALRREGHSLLVQFESPELRTRFHDELKVYENGVAGMRSNPGETAARLPETLFWGLWFLRRSLPEPRRVSDDALITTVFACATLLVANHNRQVLVLRNSGLVNDGMQIARRVVGELRSKASPRGCRDLIRLFGGSQKKERFIPIFDVLVEAGVLLKDNAGAYLLGPVEIEEVADLLVVKLDGVGDAER